MKLIMTADYERHEYVCKEAGANVVLDKVEDRDLAVMLKILLLTIVACLRGITTLTV